MIDNSTWDEADNKAKNLIYLSLGAHATNIFHQRFPHKDLQKCTTDALVEQLKESFTQTRNENFDRFQFFRFQQKEGESLQVFNSLQIQNCRRCGNKFLQGHLNICPAKNEACRICKKIGHFAKLCRSEMPTRPI